MIKKSNLKVQENRDQASFFTGLKRLSDESEIPTQELLRLLYLDTKQLSYVTCTPVPTIRSLRSRGLRSIKAGRKVLFKLDWFEKKFRKFT